jgi:hypothetical protein
MVFGLALVLALLFGVASMALGANGKPFILGKVANTASKVTGLVKRGAGPALSLRVGSGPPLAVDSDAQVANLNADQLDGKDSSEVGSELWAHVNSNGTLVRGNGVQASGRFSTGYYFVQFNRDVSFCGYVATTTDGYTGPTGTVQGAAYGYPQEVFVYTVAGTERVDLPFHVVVTC